jgi:hypothetical protein
MLYTGFQILDKSKKEKLLITSSIPTCPAKLIAMAGQAETSIQYLPDFYTRT